MESNFQASAVLTKFQPFQALVNSSKALKTVIKDSQFVKGRSVSRAEDNLGWGIMQTIVSKKNSSFFPVIHFN